ncbi:hypothetical protein EVAR_21679_1 [Eumeta japonica]|uniref:Uncharacterized protein n=1 Tax=Eumeta variegata TaxID=151549 RepID=A0A4C1VG22_EUMVA|nr:hypothetical protein EVAR_21679_1 [Eumeta japonica]
MIKKINSFRTSYLKKKKVLDTRSGSGADDEYKTKVWYFKLLEFLDGSEHILTTRSNLDETQSIEGLNEYVLRVVTRKSYHIKTSIKTSLKSHLELSLDYIVLYPCCGRFGYSTKMDRPDHTLTEYRRELTASPIVFQPTHWMKFSSNPYPPSSFHRTTYSFQRLATH